jgi:hypothetical protein
MTSSNEDITRIDSEELIKESSEIRYILNIIGDTKFDNEFSINNKGINYILGNDSKIISKIYELIIIDTLKKLLYSKGFEYIENDIQNKYPDFIIKSKIQTDKYYAIDIKSTYLKTETQINGFTLGTYKGYFKNRDCLTSIVKPYNNFNKHFCICIIYERLANKIPVKHIMVREKWEIARNSTGSGNTCNIGSIKSLKDLLANKSHFENEDAFDTFWLGYKC